MPELPDVVAYIEALRPRIVGQPLERVRLASPFLLRSVSPPLDAAAGRTVGGVTRIGKRIAVGLTGDLYLVLHLMIAGRLRWREAGIAVPRKLGLAAFDFPGGTLLLTEAGARKRASLHVVQGQDAVAAFDRGGIEPLTCTLEAFTRALRGENHTVKRSLTDPRLLSGIGNAYSDEILHRARLSPLKWTQRLSGEEIARLHRAMQDVLREWTDTLVDALGGAFPETVTAFRDGMAVHGRYRRPCPVCGAPVQRIVYAANACNYCPACQTGGKILADRALSRLLGTDWPRTLEELEDRLPPR
jgi:formamidopyrimidine-DNA glycosylase